MGNLLGTPKQKPLTIHDLTVKVGEYRTINEGDPEMKEDPEFPLQMMKEALDNNNTIEGNVVQGTYVYYPNKRKPKMWIGNYRILNPEDILCKNIAAKIGMNEEEWKNYIERKRKASEDEGLKKGKDYPSFSHIMEQKDTIKSIMENSNLQYEYDTEYMNNAEIIYDNSYYSNDKNLPQATFQSNEFDENSPNKDMSYYPDESNGTNEMYDNTTYVKKLNEQMEQIREEQVKIIEQQRDDILSYSNSKSTPLDQIEEANEYISEQLEGDNFELIKSFENTPEKAKSILKNKNLYSGKPLFSQVSSSKKKSKISKEYTTLTSMSTKASLTLNENSPPKNKNHLSHRIVRNAMVH